MTPALWQAMLIAGCIGFGCAIGVHYPIGYLSASHLAPACAGAILYLCSMAATKPQRRTFTNSNLQPEGG